MRKPDIALKNVSKQYIQCIISSISFNKFIQ